MAKQNCWEYLNCGREPGGAKAAELGVCRATTEARTNGMNSGTNGGRVCWVVAGTLCGGQAEGTNANKVYNCMKCEFFKQVALEEWPNLVKTKDVMDRLK